MNQAYLKILAQKFLDCTATEDEKKQLHGWYEKSALSDEEPEIVFSDSFGTSDELKQKILQRLRENRQRDLESTPLNSGLFRRFMVWTASSAAVLLCALFAWNKMHMIPKEEFKTVHAPFGQTVSFQLSDGSQVWLNSGSTITFPVTFKDKLREITLTDGQAFFDVVHETKRPFVVRTKTVNVTVLGTSFDVKAYDNDPQVKVSVKTGKVGVTLTNKPDQPAVMLLPDKQIVVQNKKSGIKVNEISAPAIAPWKDNKIILEDEMLSEVFHALERKFDQHILVENAALEQEKITMTLDNQPLTDVLKVMSFSKKFNYSQLNDSTIVIR